jgi:hypothetical protein
VVTVAGGGGLGDEVVADPPWCPWLPRRLQKGGSQWESVLQLGRRRGPADGRHDEVAIGNGPRVVVPRKKKPMIVQKELKSS